MADAFLSIGILVKKARHRSQHYIYKTFKTDAAQENQIPFQHQIFALQSDLGEE
jgi:hypothetical protein